MRRPQSAAAKRIDLLSILRELPDPRVERTRLHKFADLLLIASCARLCGAESFEDRALFGDTREPWRRTFLELPHGIPSHDTFNRLFAALDPPRFLDAFMRWTQSLRAALADEVVAIDGKALRRAIRPRPQRQPGLRAPGNPKLPRCRHRRRGPRAGPLRAPRGKDTAGSRPGATGRARRSTGLPTVENGRACAARASWNRCAPSTATPAPSAATTSAAWSWRWKNSPAPCAATGASKTNSTGCSTSSSAKNQSRARAGHAPENLATLRRWALHLLTAGTRKAKRSIKARIKAAGGDHNDLLHLLAPNPSLDA